MPKYFSLSCRWMESNHRLRLMRAAHETISATSALFSSFYSCWGTLHISPYISSIRFRKRRIRIRTRSSRTFCKHVIQLTPSFWLSMIIAVRIPCVSHDGFEPSINRVWADPVYQLQQWDLFLFVYRDSYYSDKQNHSYSNKHYFDAGTI